MSGLKSKENRRHHRLALRLPVLTRRSDGTDCSDGWTANISAGGMYVTVQPERMPQQGQDLLFQLAVPAGESYWAGGLTIDGIGKVFRVEPLDGGQAGLAIQFTTPLSLCLEQ